MAQKTIALVTGANTGIGEVVAYRLAEEFGYHVYVAGRQLGACEKVATIIRSRGFEATALYLDLDNDETIKKAIKVIDDTYARLDVLINNAAIKLDPLNPGQTLRELCNASFSTNTIGHIVVTDAALPLIRRCKNPRIVFVSSSTASLAGAANPESAFYNIDLPAYNASKAALNMTALNYARWLKDVGAMVNVVCPGYTKTQIVDFDEQGGTVEDASMRIVEMATLEEGGPTATFSDRNGTVPW